MMSGDSLFENGKRIEILCGDAIKELKKLPNESVHCVVTSPPYWGLRDYGVKDQIGLESTPEEYVKRLVKIFREIRRVLRDDGTLWLNLGDSYYNYRPGGDALEPQTIAGKSRGEPKKVPRRAYPQNGLKEKDLCGIPWRVAFALQADGWYLRSDIVWAKPNPMPESVTDRPTKAHEYVFLFTKSPRYFYDIDAIREDYKMNRWGGRYKTNEDVKVNPNEKRAGGQGSLNRMNYDCYPHSGRNCRSVWIMNTKPYPDAHFATFPIELPERCIKAGTSQKGCCPECGAPFKRIIERVRPEGWEDDGPKTEKEKELRDISKEIYGGNQKSRSISDIYGRALKSERKEKGWEQTCECPSVAPSEIDRYGTGEAGIHRKVGQKYQDWLEKHPPQTIGWEENCECDLEPVPCIVLDPFAGSGTTGEAAIRLGRRAILIELNPEYIKLINKRTKADNETLERFI